MDATQGAWMVLAAESLPHGKKAVPASPITSRSSRLKRKVFSTFGGETQAMLQGVNEVDWLQVMYRDAISRCAAGFMEKLPQPPLTSNPHNPGKSGVPPGW